MKISELIWVDCEGKRFPPISAPGCPAIHRPYFFRLWQTDFIVTHGDVEVEVTDTEIKVLDVAYNAKCEAQTKRVTK